MIAHRRKLLIAAALAASVDIGIAPPARADVIELKDGTSIEGSLKKTEDGYDVATPDGKVKKVSSGEVKSVQLKTSGSADDVQKRYDSLKRSTDNVGDPKVAINRFKDFVAKNPTAPQAADAKKEMALWQERLDKGMTRSGDRWVTPAELGSIQEESLASAIQAWRLLREGKLKEAGPILDQAIKGDPKNASAHYLRGVMFYRQDQIGPAKKAFETVVPLVPDHAPTQNNLGVVLWKQNSYGAAMLAYDAALLAAPGEPLILNNVAEALNALPASQRDSLAAKKLVKHFNEQDDALAETMAKDGRYRWGATWVTAKELDALEAKEKEIKDKIEVLDDQFRAAKDQLESIDGQIADTNRTLRRVEADSYGYDASGRPVKRAYPPVYYELRRDLGDLQRRYANQQAEIDRLRKEAKKTQQDMPTPRYTGVQKLIEVEGTPLLPRVDPANGANANADPAAGAGNAKAPATQPTDPPVLPPGPPFRPKEARMPMQPPSEN